MKNALLVLCLLVGACGNVPPQPSLLTDLSLPYYGQGSWFATIYFEGNGTFIYSEANCSIQGSWQDLSSGSTQGIVILQNTFNSCPGGALGQFGVPYVFNNGVVTFSGTNF